MAERQVMASGNAEEEQDEEKAEERRQLNERSRELLKELQEKELQRQREQGPSVVPGSNPRRTRIGKHKAALSLPQGLSKNLIQSSSRIDRYAEYISHASAVDAQFEARAKAISQFANQQNEALERLDRRHDMISPGIKSHYIKRIRF